MPTFKSFGLTDYVGSPANIGSGVGYWTFTHFDGDPSPGTVEIDFGYNVMLKSIAWIKSQGSLGRWNVVGSNTPATSVADVYVPSNGDVQVAGYLDIDGRNLFHTGFTTAFRYYRLLLVGPEQPSLGIFDSDFQIDPNNRNHKITDIECNAAMVAKAFGYSTAAGVISNVVDLDDATAWTPYATSWPAGTPTISPPTSVALPPDSGADTYPALQIDMGEAVSVTKFKLHGANAGTLGAAMLYASNNPATSLSDTIQVGDVRIGNYTEAELCSNVELDTDLRTSGTPYRYYRFIATRGIGPGPDGSALYGFTPGFFPPAVNPTVAWNPLDKTSNIILSNFNLTATLGATSFTNEGVRSVGVEHSTGKWYLEFTNILSGGGGGKYGFTAAADTLGSAGQCGVNPTGFVQGPVGSAALGSSPDGHTLCLALDLDNLRLWARLDAGAWSTVGGIANPATNAGGVDITGVVTPLHIYLWEQSFGAGHATLNAGGSAFLQAVPAGFSAWQEPSTYHAFFIDDGGLNDIVMSVTSPGSPFVVRLSDGDSDALMVTPTITQNLILRADFTDSAELDAFSDIFPSIIVQTMIQTSGR